MIKNGKIWPIIIAVSIFGVVLLSYWTIKETAQADLTQSNIYMDNYHNVDDNINDIIMAEVSFNKKYDVSLESIELSAGDEKIVYTITDKQGKPVLDAKLELVLSRPVSDAADIKLEPTDMQNGRYIFEGFKLPKEGRWDLLLKITIGDKQRYYNLKADTRTHKALEF